MTVVKFKLGVVVFFASPGSMQYPNQGSNLCSLHWKHGHEGNPKFILEEKN